MMQNCNILVLKMVAMQSQAPHRRNGGTASSAREKAGFHRAHLFVSLQDDNQEVVKDFLHCKSPEW
jgi:hypothetical protein